MSAPPTTPGIADLEAVEAEEVEYLEVHAAEWPERPAPAAFHGPAGEFVRLVEPHSEADPVALLVLFLVGFGSLIGRGAHTVAEADDHYANLFAVLVGESSRGRKGTAQGHVQKVLGAVDRDWADARIASGLSSGEGLIWAVRDPIEKMTAIKERGQPVRYEPVIADEGEADKRLWVVETEFASPLAVMRREGSNLSPQVRRAWDTGNLRSLIKNSPNRATGAHISLVGHITKGELARHLTETEAGNGFANRFLWVCTRRSKLLPHGGQIQKVDFAPLVREVAQAAEFARLAGELRRDAEANALWENAYPTLTEDRPGLLGAITARSEAQALRLSLVYALLDRSPAIRREHLEAALALWDYCDQSAHYIFGDALGDPVADELSAALRGSGDQGMTRTDIRDLFSRNRRAGEVERAIGTLMRAGLARREKQPTGGRPSERLFACTPTTKTTKTTKAPPVPAALGTSVVNVVSVVGVDEHEIDDAQPGDDAGDHAQTAIVTPPDGSNQQLEAAMQPPGDDGDPGDDKNPPLALSSNKPKFGPGDRVAYMPWDGPVGVVEQVGEGYVTVRDEESGLLVQCCGRRILDELRPAPPQGAPTGPSPNRLSPGQRVSSPQGPGVVVQVFVDRVGVTLDSTGRVANFRPEEVSAIEP